MNVEYINSFIEASHTVLKSIAGIDSSLGKTYLKTSPYPSDSLVIVIGLIGDIRGQVIFSMSKNIACKLASAMMMGMAVCELDEVSKSAVTEAANMILGNAATILSKKGIKIDITPPSLLMGYDMQISTPKMKTICMQINISASEIIELDISALE